MKEVVRLLTPKLSKLFNYLHQNPEVSWQEYKTTNYIESLFKEHDCKVTTFEDITGLIVQIGTGKPVVARCAGRY